MGARWTVGTIEIARVVDLELALPSEHPVPAWCVPHFSPGGCDVGLAFSAFAIRAGRTRLVVDPWLANDGPRDRPDAAATADRLVGELGDIGLPAGAVDIVVNTHLDGIGWNTRPDAAGEWEPTFPAARYVWSQAQLDRHAGDGRLAPLVAAGVLDGVHPPVELAPGVTLEDAPGHEAGHMVVWVRNGGQVACIAGHLFISPLQVSDPSISLDEDPVTAARTRTDLLRTLAASGGLLLGPLLGGPGGGRVRADGRSWRLEA